MNDDTPLPFELPAVARKKVTAAFDGGRITSDGGVMLLAAADRPPAGMANCPRSRVDAVVTRQAPNVHKAIKWHGIWYNHEESDIHHEEEEERLDGRKRRRLSLSADRCEN
jgi:hypothetical protein